MHIAEAVCVCVCIVYASVACTGSGDGQAHIHRGLLDVYPQQCIMYKVFKKTGPCFISLYLWQFITIWTGNMLMVCCKLSLSSDMLVKAYSKP